MPDNSIKYIRLNVQSYGLSLEGGMWVVQMCRVWYDSGTAIARRYPYTAGDPMVVRCSGKYKTWSGWQAVVLDAPPVWYDLPLEGSFVPDGEGAVNRYCRDQFGRVTVRLQCAAAAAEGVSSEHRIAVLPAGFRPSGEKLTCMFGDGHAGQSGYIHFYSTGSFASGCLSDGENLKKINCEVSFYAG